MQNTEPEGGAETARDEIDISSGESQPRPRGGDRRDGINLFGGYTGPERRSGADRRRGA